MVLEEIPGVLGSDYINASWINVRDNIETFDIILKTFQGYKHPNAYIAAQGTIEPCLFESVE